MHPSHGDKFLAEYARTGSESAFCELVDRYIGFVYSAALRLVSGDRHLAEDVAQMVFIDLAQKARHLPRGVMLGGWLHQRTFNIAAPMLRSKKRRESREKEVMDMSTIKDDSGEYWQEFGPLLDEAITQLGTEDRKAIILRFFERLDFRAIGKALGSNEDAARMRVSRALDKLQVLLKHRGISSSAVALGTALAAEPAASAAEFSGNVAAAALAKANAGFACGTIKATLMKLTTMTKLQTAIFGAVVIAGLTGSLVFRHQARVLDEENGELRRQMVQLQSDYNLVSSRLAHVSQSGLRSDRLRELLRLRNEVGSLRRQQRELERIAATTKSIPSNQGNQNTPFGSPPAKPAPFQVQMVLEQADENSEALTNSASAEGETLYLQKTPLLDYTAIRSASVSTNPSTGAPQIDVEFNDAGSELFAEVTKANINKRLALVLNGQLYSAPMIRSEIVGGKAQVTGSFTEQQARELADKINDAVVR